MSKMVGLKDEFVLIAKGPLYTVYMYILYISLQNPCLILKYGYVFVYDLYNDMNVY